MNIKYLIAGILCFPVIANAECFNAVAKKYNYDPDYLRAIAKKESSYNARAIGYNKDGSRDIGLMQINTSNFAWLKRRFPTLSSKKLLTDPCFNIQVGGYVLNENFKTYGRKWLAVGAYNAGGKNNPKRVKIRYQYAKKVNEYYNDIKRGKLKPPYVKI